MRSPLHTLLRTALLGATFRRSDVAVPNPAGAALVALLFMLAGALRRGVVDGVALEPALAGTLLAGAVLIAVSAAGLWAELVLVACTSIGVDLLASLAVGSGFVEPGAAAAPGWFTAWQLGAVFVALLRYRFGRLAGGVAAT